MDEPWWRTDAEVDLARAVHGWPDALEPVFVAVMQTGTRWFCLVVVAALLLARRTTTALAVAVAGTTAWSATTILKQLLDSPRPTAELLGAAPRVAEAGAGLPSTHTAISTAMAVALVVAARHGSVPRWIGAVAVAAALVTGVARVYLGVHWPTDVAGGAVVGLACGLLGALVERQEVPAEGAVGSGGSPRQRRGPQ